MNITSKLRLAWRNLLTSGMDENLQSPRMRRVVFTNIFALTAATGLFLFVIVNIVEANRLLLTVGELAVALFSVFIMVYLRKTRDIARTQTLTMVAAILLTSMLFFTGGMAKTGIFWLFLLPPAAFYLKGKRWGWAWLAIVGVEIVIMIALRAANIGSVPYSIITLRQFSVCFIIVSLFISNYEQIRDDYEVDIAAKAQELISDIQVRQQAEEEIKRQLAEKEILLKEVHHRIKNNIASVGGLISLRLQAISNPAAVAVLQDALSRVNSMRVLYDMLLLSEGYKDVSVGNFVASLADQVVALFPGNTKITIDKHVADFHLDPKRLFPLGIIINELLTNIMKYAFINRESGLIKISLTYVDSHVMLSIQDDGNGLPDGFDIKESKGFGLMLVKMLSQQLGGSFSMENHTGTRCKIEFNT
jgi:two-component sensor histidine kinase